MSGIYTVRNSHNINDLHDCTIAQLQNTIFSNSIQNPLQLIKYQYTILDLLHNSNNCILLDIRFVLI
jgi:hypothetical protein